MNSRNWVRLFLSTLLVGGVTSGIVGIIVRWNEFQTSLTTFDFVEMLSVLLWLIGVGFIFSIISQMGFFAYLTVHRFGLGIFKSAKLWNIVQVVLIVFALGDLVYLRYNAFAKEGESIFGYMGFAIIILVIGAIIAGIKSKQTNKGAFVPALFFMVVVTIIEWVPALRVNKESWLYIMLYSLIVCNAYQLLILHKLNEKGKTTNKKPSK
ncbi:KinB-signaling pathway activation protein [Cytobacillus spongiae]|uniref:KinB-signaling pathway activation protein n=1 Tax=Cytobacillus spongiae TaxID=2901381 RepID=UPI001F2F4C95|nr:KinB-signaling pathway activation protein [Cytobacillus spongiae]UII56114.1 KinB-signaling pathway activation protein [Cytobacillus spongiae]